MIPQHILTALLRIKQCSFNSFYQTYLSTKWLKKMAVLVELLLKIVMWLHKRYFPTSQLCRWIMDICWWRPVLLQGHVIAIKNLRWDSRIGYSTHVPAGKEPPPSVRGQPLPFGQNLQLPQVRLPALACPRGHLPPVVGIGRQAAAPECRQFYRIQCKCRDAYTPWVCGCCAVARLFRSA